MTLEGDQHSDNPGNAAEYESTTESSKPGGELSAICTSPKSPQTPPTKTNTKESTNEWRKNTKFGLEIFGVLLLLAYTWFSCLQWLQIRYTNQLTARALDGNGEALRQTLTKMQAQIVAVDAGNTLSKDALLATQRAFLSVASFNISLVGTVYKVFFSWSNGGSTPTRSMREVTHVQLFRGKMPSNFAMHNAAEKGTEMFVGPKSNSAGKSIELPASDLDAVATHSGHLYFWGWAEYSDVFANTGRHLSQFCYEITDVTRSPSSPGSQNIITDTCDRGNCTDDECKTP